MQDDPIIEKIHEVRRNIMAQCGHDAMKFNNYLKQLDANQKEKGAGLASKRRPTRSRIQRKN